MKRKKLAKCCLPILLIVFLTMGTNFLSLNKLDETPSKLLAHCYILIFVVRYIIVNINTNLSQKGTDLNIPSSVSS